MLRSRSACVELSPALEQVILRGLERDRSRRWPDLEALRQALLGLVPQPLTGLGQLRRVAAYALDAVLLGLVALAIGTALRLPNLPTPLLLSASRSVSLLLFLAYFVVLEHRLGGSLGKQVMGLRVCTGRSIDPR